MAYRFRLYAPTDSGIISLTVAEYPSGVVRGTFYPQGTGTPCVDWANQTTGFSITPALASGVSVSRWVINHDGMYFYQSGQQCGFTYDSTATNISIRLEVSGWVASTYYAYLSYNANGGMGAPSTHQVNGVTQSFAAQIASTVPIRDGYTFAGWWLYNQSAYGTFQPGSFIQIAGSTDVNTAYQSYNHTLYAQWVKKETGGGAYIGNGSTFDKATPYIWNGSAWVKAVPYIWNGSWEKGL